MRVLHISDLHFGAKGEMENRFIIENFKRIQEYAILNEIRHIIISGDIFDNDEINLRYRDLFLNDHLNYLIIPGNHDNDITLKSFFSTFNNVKYFNKKPYDKVIIGDMAIYGVPYDNETTPFDLFSAISNEIVYDKTEENIILLHGSPVGVNFGMIDADDTKIKHFPFHFEDLLPVLYIKKKIYIALGHYHKSFRKWRFDNVLCCMPGSIYPLSVKEKENRAFSIYDSKTHEIMKYIPGNITNLSYVYLFISPFETNNIADSILNLLEDTSPLSKAFVDLDGYINNIDKLDEIKNNINTTWKKRHKIPIEWNINVSAIDLIKPEIKNILLKIDELSANKSFSSDIINNAKKLIFESNKSLRDK